MRLIIAEKPSVARAVASAVGATSRRDGYIEGGGHVVSWCRGHLVELSPPDAYEAWDGKWDLAKLPMVPARDGWRWETPGDAADQYEVLAGLLARADVDEVVNACDADREGEAIFRRVYEKAGCAKPVLRLWSTSLTPDQIRADLAAMRPQSDYDGLAAAAEGRAKADWLVGMNASRAYSCLYPGARLSAGRVQTPTLALVAERTRRIADFASEPFFQVVLDLGGFEAFGERLPDKGEADALARACKNEGQAVVVEYEEKTEKNRAPRLYDLTGLQRDASTRAGLSADETLAVLQSLYEKGLATYPRTESKFIGSSDVRAAESAMRTVADARVVGNAAANGFDPERADVSRVVDDAKVHGHGAVLPTELCDAEAVSALQGAELAVMRLVCCRLLAAVMEPAERVRRRLVVECAGERFKASGSTVTDASWIAVDDAARALVGGGREESADADDPEQSIPSGLSQGERRTVAGASVREGKTTPPRPYTDASLLSAMENAGRGIEDKELRAAIEDDESHSGGLGTPATRAAVIEGLVSKGYVRRKGRSLTATEKGLELVDTVADSLKTPEMTAQWELELARVEREGAPLDAFLDGIEDYTRRVVSDARDSFDPARAARLSGAKSCGACPACGQPVVRKPGAGAWQCSSNRWVKDGDGFELAAGCGFRLNVKQCGRALSDAQAAKLVAGQTVHLTGLKSRKTGRDFEADARLVGPPWDGWVKLSFGAPKKRPAGGGRRGGGRR